MSKTLAQIFALNPATTVADTDLFYLVQSPYTVGTDAAILGSDLKTALGKGTVTSLSAGTGITLTPNPITTIGTISLTTPVSLANGGTNASLVASNGGIFYSTATAGAILAGTATAGQILRSGASTAPSWSTATYPATGGTSGNILISNGTNYIASTSLWPNTVAPAGKIIRSDGTVNTYTTTVYPDLVTQNSLLYGSASNTIGLIATVTRSVLTVPSTGLPTYVALTDGQIVIGSTAGSPAAASLSAGTGVTITPGSNTITISATGTGGTVTSITAGTGITLTPSPITTTGSVALTVPVTEILGGTNQTTYTLGDTLYSSAANTLSKLAGNITAVKQYLSQTGTGAVSAAPAWATISGSDITGAALTKTDDTNVTLALTGTPTTALLRATNLALGWTGQLSLARGGTNASLTASNGGIFYSTATAGAILAGTATANQILMSGASTTPAWSTATYPATAGTSGNVLTSDGTNWASSPAAGVTLLTTKGDLFGFSTVNARVPVATGDGKVLQVSSAAAVGLAYSTPTYPSASGGAGTILRSDGTNNLYTTSTYPNTNAINTLLYASSANVMAALATANNGVLVTDSGGIPSIAATIKAVNLLPFGNSGISATGLTTFDLSTATGGTVTISGLSFQPSVVIFVAGLNSTSSLSVGIDNGTTHFAAASTGVIISLAFDTANSIVMYTGTGGTTHQNGHITSFTSDGFVITFTKAGSPTGTVNIGYLAFK